MSFFIITILIMAICIWGIHRLARRFGFPLEPRALLLCAVMALAVNFTAISASSFLTARHYLLLTVLVLSSAALVTFCNERLFSQSPGEEVEEEQPSFADILAPAMAVPATEAAAPIAAITPEAPAAPVIQEALPEPEPEPEVAADTVPDTSLFDEISTRFEAELASRHEEIETKLATAVAGAFTDTADDVFAETEDATETLEPVPEEAPLTEEAPISEETLVSGEAVVTEEAAVTAVAEEPAPAEPVPAEEPPFDSATVAGFATLDEFLNYADEQKQLHYNQNAIYTYEQALIRYSDDDYAPFIVIDMANICKAAGQYRKAIAIYQLAFTLRTVRGSKTIREDFNNTLAYLEAVEYILSQHNAPDMPYAEIPSEYLDEIEQYFSSRQKEKSVS